MGLFGGRSSRYGFSVVDIETTGLFTGYHHRIVEIAVVRMDTNGQITDEYCTLVNPQRDIGESSAVHGLRAADLLDAPSFADIAGDILDRLEDSIFVAHNVRFDHDFLVYEYGRVGYELPELPTLCTMTLAGTEISGSSLRLTECCRALGLSHETEHAALHDARAAAAILARLMERADLPASGCRFDPRPALSRSGRVHLRGQRVERPSYLSHLASRMEVPTQGLSESRTVPEYMNVLDRILEDRVVTPSEGTELEALATSWGLSGRDIRVTHAAYMQALVKAALADGVVTDRERRDIDKVAGLLGIEAADVDLMIGPGMPVQVEQPTPKASSLAGLTVCFTGALECCYEGQTVTRELAEALATKAGLIPQERVTKKLDILVIADPDSMSSKARKAREYGTRIMAESSFWTAIGVEVS